MKSASAGPPISLEELCARMDVCWTKGSSRGGLIASFAMSEFSFLVMPYWLWREIRKRLRCTAILANA